MPEEATTPIVTPQENQKPFKEKQSKLTWILLGIYLFLIGVLGVWFLFINQQKNQSKPSTKIASSSSATSASNNNKKGVLYTKNSDKEDRFYKLGDLMLYEISPGKEINLTTSGNVDQFLFKLSPDGKKVAYREYDNGKENLWVYAFQTKKAQKISEFSDVVSSTEYRRIDNIVWKEDSEKVAYLVLNRDPNDDPRTLKKATVYMTDLASNEKSFDLPLQRFPSLLAWTGNEIYIVDGTDGGPYYVRSLNEITLKITDKTQLFANASANALPGVSGSPDSKKIAILDDYLTRIVDLSTNKEIYKVNLDGLGWVGSGVGFMFRSDVSGKTKVTTYDFQTKQSKSAFFSIESLNDDNSISAFSDFTSALSYQPNFDSKLKTLVYNYTILNLSDSSTIKLPFTTSTTSSGKAIPVENF